jgi:3-phenylpropionate/trans-cinnamate dioxygenase ferredoxin subunit
MSPVRVAGTAELADGAVMRVEVDGVGVALVRIGEDFYAIGDRCSHADVSLSGGEVDADECTLECPKHGSEFDLRTGDPRSLPAVKPVPVWEVTVEQDGIWLEAREEAQ